MASALPSELIARIRAASIAAADAEAAEAGGGYQKSRPPSVRIAAGGRVVRAPQKVSLRATLRLVDMFGHKEADVDASAGAVQRAWRKRRQSVDLGAAEGLSEAQI